MVKIELECTKHPRYKAKLPPRCDCSDCRALYNVTQELRRFAAEGRQWFPVEYSIE